MRRHISSLIFLSFARMRSRWVFPFDLEFVLASFAADEGEAQEVEGLRLAKPAPVAAFRRKAARFPNPGANRFTSRHMPGGSLACPRTKVVR
jgi:hypothetical protein